MQDFVFKLNAENFHRCTLFLREQPDGNDTLCSPCRLLHIDQGLTAGTFVIAALSTDIPMLLIVYVRVILPGALTWRDLGLRSLPLGYVLRTGLAAGLIGLVVITLLGVLAVAATPPAWD